MGRVRALARVLVAVLAVAAAALAAAGPARAGAEWCETDPLLVVATPGGHLVAVYLLVGAQGLEHLPAALAASLLASAAPDSTAGGRATRVTVTVTVPDDAFGAGFPARAAVSSGPLGGGTAYDSIEGVSGAPMTLRFTLAVP